ncbi:MAG: hypothetical protein CM15mP113_3180 [Pseudomonadota bacterium]|nr:MAG: hypothetical protein CM15mP113_3180 [Pseudomonadota bacterium]
MVFWDIDGIHILKIEKFKFYHIYLEDKCLFKNVNEEEFNIIGNKLYTSYWKEELTYTEVSETPYQHLKNLLINATNTF